MNSDLSKSYMATKPFYMEFYQYDLKKDSSGRKRGYLRLTPNTNSTNCPDDRVLHFTGKKLVPQINPMEFLLGNPNPNPKLLISVYDSVTFLRGYIDPSSATFAVYNQILPSSFDLGTSGSNLPPLGGSAKLNVGPSAAFPSGDYSVVPAEAGSACVGTIANMPGKLTMIVNTTALTPTSVILLTPVGKGPTLVAVSDIQVQTGQFTISAGSVCTVNWLIVN